EKLVTAKIAKISQRAGPMSDGYMNNEDKLLRTHLLGLLDGGQDHAKFANVVADFPPKRRGEVPTGLPHAAWMLLEHMRIVQWDILEFSRSSKYEEMKWPDDYWPKSLGPPSAAAWD